MPNNYYCYSATLAWARCRPGSFCACSCVASIPVGANDTFAFVDPEGAQGPGTVSVSVLGNDASPDGSPVSIAPGSVESLSPGVTVTSVDEAAGIINVDIPNDTPSVLLRYVVASSGGGLGAPAYAVGTPSVKYPAGACVAGDKCIGRLPISCNNLKCAYTQKSACAALAYPKSGQSYCMASFRSNCADPDNAGCDRCAIYKIMQACKAFFTTNPPAFPKPAEKPTQAYRYYSKTGNYVIVKSLNGDKSATGGQLNPETGSNLCIMPQHYILMPTAACTGVDDNSAQCTGSSVTYWEGAVRHGYLSGPGDLGFGNSDWAVMINAPDERGQHQMHIHVAPIVPADATKNILMAARAAQLQTDRNKPPTVLSVTLGGRTHTVAAYFIVDNALPPTTVVQTDVWGLAARIHAQYAGTSANQQSYGVALIPKKGGYIVAAAYGFSDVQVLDTAIQNNPRKDYCQAACAPFK
ncbi:hypothetical protein OEZ86_002152 [Tetradesmus obliquus]|nr:hypothetical protein OEZ86_002152 [Tetradesmus obliquus]